jgi:hypothetical protein
MSTQLPADVWRIIALELLPWRDRMKLRRVCKALSMYIKPIPRPPRRPAPWFDNLVLRYTSLVCWVCLQRKWPLHGVTIKKVFSHGLCKQCRKWARVRIKWAEPGTQREWCEWIVHLTNMHWKLYGYPEEIRIKS